MKIMKENFEDILFPFQIRYEKLLNVINKIISQFLLSKNKIFDT